MFGRKRKTVTVFVPELADDELLREVAAVRQIAERALEKSENPDRVKREKQDAKSRQRSQQVPYAR